MLATRYKSVLFIDMPKRLVRTTGQPTKTAAVT